MTFWNLEAYQPSAKAFHWAPPKQEVEDSSSQHTSGSTTDESGSKYEDSEEESVEQTPGARLTNSNVFHPTGGGVATAVHHRPQFTSTRGTQHNKKNKADMPSNPVKTNLFNTSSSYQTGSLTRTPSPAMLSQQPAPTSKLFDFPSNPDAKMLTPFKPTAASSSSFGFLPSTPAVTQSKPSSRNGTAQEPLFDVGSSRTLPTRPVPTLTANQVSANTNPRSKNGMKSSAKMTGSPIDTSTESSGSSTGYSDSGSSSRHSYPQTQGTSTNLPTPTASLTGEDPDLSRYRPILRRTIRDASAAAEPKSRAEELKTAPLITWSAKKQIQEESQGQLQFRGRQVFPQYTVLGESIGINGGEEAQADRPFDPILLNTNAPWSAFICGSQGSGKSHTLSCILEGCLHPSKAIGELMKPLAGLMFHYDAHEATVCEAAHLCSAGVPVTVLVSPSNYLTMKTLYSQIPGASKYLRVEKFYLQPKQLNTERLKKLMAFSEKDGSVPLYMEALIRILREMRLEKQGSNDLDYAEFRKRLDDQDLTGRQTGPLNLRLALLDSLLDLPPPGVQQSGRKKRHIARNFLEPRPGCLIILDLTDPFIDNTSACALFEIAMALFLSGSGDAAPFTGAVDPIGKIIALDEAHNYLDASASAQSFTSAVLKGIREQRHRALRVVIATQEPTINPALLDLCSMTVVHRFSSPEWLRVLQRHIGGLALLSAADKHRKMADRDVDGAEGESEDEEETYGTARTVKEVFERIVTLGLGEALLFAPSAVLRSGAGKLGTGFVRIKVRDRMSADGGKSVLAVS